MRKRFAAAAAMMTLASGGSALAQGTIVVDPEDNPAVRQGALPQQPFPPGAPVQSIPVLQADFNAKTGGGLVRFDRDAFVLDDAARQKLAIQAAWLRMNPMVAASIEGHADIRHTRDHAFALGERRAAAVHSFFLAQGVSPAQLKVVSWGRERPAVDGAHDATWLQNSRVVTVLRQPEPGTLMPPLLPPPLPPID